MADGTRRLDVEIAARGLARSRAHAAQLLAAGLVTVDGRAGRRAAHPVSSETRIEVDQDHYVSRAAQKLVAALDGFPVDLADRLVLDVGASTGGFTQVALERGAREVIALDVGHDQLAASVRDDPRVRVVEGANARELTRESLAELAGTREVPSVVVGDLSFISLRLVLGPLVETVGPDADFVLLVKPQFEVGRGGVREGIVRDAALKVRALVDVLDDAMALGLGTGGVLSSPISGTEGNQEFLIWLTRTAGRHPTQWRRAIDALV